MKITIQLPHDTPPEAVARAKMVAEATELNDIAFSGDEIAVELGDFLCISEGAEHSNAANLFALVQRVVEPGFAFAIDSEADGVDRIRVPFAEGGFVRVPA